MMLQRMLRSLASCTGPLPFITPMTVTRPATSHWMTMQKQQQQQFSSKSNDTNDDNSGNNDVKKYDIEHMPFVHFGQRLRHRDRPKFKSPRKRASKLFHELNIEACAKMRDANPKIWQESIRVGDAVELKMVFQGGLLNKDATTTTSGEKQTTTTTTTTQDVDKIRGVVLGMVNRGLGSSMILRDVVYGLPIERRIPMYSPMIKDVTVLERNFIFKGKKKVKRAKLYYFRDRNPLLTKVSKY